MTGKKIEYQRIQLSGMNFDIPPSMLEPNVYTQGNNVEVYDIGMRAIRGHSEAYGDRILAPEHLTFNKANGQFYWLYSGADGIAVTDGQNDSIISPVIPISSIYPANWTDCNLNGLIVLNNEVDAPIWWDNVPATPMQPLPGWDPLQRCASMRSYNYFLIAMNVNDGVSDFPSLLAWSDAAEPGSIPQSWTPLPENSAGFNTLSDTIGALVDGIQFRDSFFLFKEHSTFIMDFIGGNLVFSFRKVFTTSGILSQNCAAEYLGNVAVLTDGDFIMTDGQQADSLIDKRMRKWLFNNIDSDNYAMSFVTSYHQENQIWCCFPGNGSTECNLALVWDATDNKFSIRDLYPPTPHIARGQIGGLTAIINWDDDPEVWDEDTTTWDQSIFNPTQDALLQADRTALLTYAINEGIDWNGVPIHSRLERTGLDFGDVHRLKLVKGIIPRIVGEAGLELTIRVGSAPNDSGEYTWTPPHTFIIGQPQIVSVFVTGRFIAYSIESERSQKSWGIAGVEFQFDWQGLY